MVSHSRSRSVDLYDTSIPYTAIMYTRAYIMYSSTYRVLSYTPGFTYEALRLRMPLFGEPGTIVPGVYEFSTSFYEKDGRFTRNWLPVYQVPGIQQCVRPSGSVVPQPATAVRKCRTDNIHLQHDTYSSSSKPRHCCIYTQRPRSNAQVFTSYSYSSTSL